MIKMYHFKDKLRTHFTYSWWKYLLVIIGGTLLITLLFDVTKPAVPDEKNISIQVVGPFINDDFHTKYEQDALELFRSHGVDEITFGNLGVGGDQDATVYEYLSALILTGAHDAYILPKDAVKEFAASDNFLRLEPYVEEGGPFYGLLPAEDLDAERISYVVRRHKEDIEVNDALVAFPLTKAYGFLVDDDTNFRDCCLVINAYSGNLETVMDYLEWFLQGKYIEKPEWYDEFIEKIDQIEP